MKPILSTNNISKVYQMGEVDVHALNSVELSIMPGEFVVLLGYSGSGKSTLLNILGGLDRPTTGEVYFHSQRIDDLNDNELTMYRRDHIGFIFQMYNLIPRLTAKENVELVTEISKDPMDPIQALKMVGLLERIDHFPSQMSGGEQQRVAIARAIAKQPALLFCDEPTGALDVSTGILVLEAIERVNQTLGTTTIVISHNVSIAEMAHRVIYLKDGQVSKVTVNETRKSAREIKW